ncbi:Potassium channel protein (plasmid) [Rhodococcus sp. WAY2]|nr:Potassium channel protein [Rhodococcus sp. WAY2]
MASCRSRIRGWAAGGQKWQHTEPAGDLPPRHALGEGGPESGLAIAERIVERDEIGGSPRYLPDIVLGVVRDGRLLRAGTAEVDVVEAGDKLLYIRRVMDRADHST